MKHLRLHNLSAQTFCKVDGDDTITIDDVDCKECLSVAVLFGENLAKSAENKLRKLVGQEPKL